MMKLDIKSMSPEMICEELTKLGQPGFRAKQVFRWLQNGCTAFDDMLDLPKTLRQQLQERFFITSPEILRKQVSQIDGTIKYLWKLSDGNAVESVVMAYEHGNTICISTEVGCAMGCAFCASTIGGLIRRLQPSEMLDQVLFAQIDSERRISNIVLMGIGEPLDNFDHVMAFLALVNHPDGLNIGMRHISLSTCGLIPGIQRLAECKLQLTLSVSLHAPDDETRRRIMPVDKRYDVDHLLQACNDYFLKTGRRISYEYAMIRGINDTPYHAELLAEKLRGTGSHVNLIRLNDVRESPLKPSRRETIDNFIRILQSRGINVTLRRRLGSDIDASCGQLRRKTMIQE